MENPSSFDGHNRKIWIDLDNSPHVPFFVPIIQDLRRRGYDLLLTARDSAQVLGLVDHYHLNCRPFGHHYGKNILIKVLGVGTRALQMIPLILREKPDLAVSHGSRSQVAVTSLLGIPSIHIDDYEHSNLGFAFIRAKWMIVPEIIAVSTLPLDRRHVLKYPGIKEDVYASLFRPDPSIREKLELAEADLVVTLRPPASDAHYRNPKSDELFASVVQYLGQHNAVRMVLLPRSERQEASIRRQWSELFSAGRIRIPQHIVDGLNLIWFSDLVISGGGTMNREAAALGVPVYSIFRGPIGAVDRYLHETGRLVLLEDASDLAERIALVPRDKTGLPQNRNMAALQVIINHIVNILESQ